MARRFKELEAKMSAESISRSDAHYREMLAEMPLPGRSGGIFPNPSRSGWGRSQPSRRWKQSTDQSD